MTRPWSIRARTTLTFAVASMVITAAVVLVVTSGSVRTLSAEVTAGGVASDAPTGVSAGGGWSAVAVEPPLGAAPSTRPAQLRGPTEDAAFVQLAAATQWQWAALGIPASGLLAGCVGWFCSRRVLRPVDRITARTRTLSASTLHERIDLDGPDDELRRLSRTIDDLLDRLETAFESQRRFVAQASHELRTPLAVQRAALQIGLGDDATAAEVAATRDELLEQNRRTEHLVESLLVLAEAERGLDGRTAPVDCRELADSVAAAVEHQAERSGVAVTCEESADDCVVLAEPVLLRQLLLNLVQNAVEYNVPGGSVLITASSQGLRVRNSGDVVDPDIASRLIEPFRRAGRERSQWHSGLGLSIVAAIARAHGWGLDVRARAEGGLDVHVGTGVSSMQPDRGRSGNTGQVGMST